MPIEKLADADGFDLVWLPSFFIPPSLIQNAVRNIAGLLRPGGVVVMGVIEASDDPIAGAVDAMITIRSGGSALEIEDASQLLQQAGLSDAGELPRTCASGYPRGSCMMLRVGTGREART